MTDQTSPDAAAKKNRRVPVLLEVTLAICKIVIVVTTAAVVGISAYQRCDALTIILRGGATLLGTGLVSFGLNWLVARGTLLAAREQMIAATSQPASILNKRA